MGRAAPRCHGAADVTYAQSGHAAFLYPRSRSIWIACGTRQLRTAFHHRFVRINNELPKTPTNKILKRELIQAGVTAAGGVLWTRVERGTAYVAGEWRGARLNASR